MGRGGGACLALALGFGVDLGWIFGGGGGTENDAGDLARVRCLGGGASFMISTSPMVNSTPKAEKK